MKVTGRVCGITAFIAAVGAIIIPVEWLAGLVGLSDIARTIG